jgi:bifunctional non-homologous end joining protein LigD
MSLKEYQRKRDFRRTSEPKGRGRARRTGNLYVIQKHAARRLHYDFRLELDGVLKSWAVPKGPSLNPAEKRLAVQVEDHPLEYGAFEGIIPQGEYGGGTVMLWDHGHWESLGDARSDYEHGSLKFKLYGEKLRGGWTLVRMQDRAAEGGKNWLLIKERDAEARKRSEPDILDQLPDSVASRRSMNDIATDHDRRWQQGHAVAEKNRPSNKARKSVKTKTRKPKSSDAGEIEVASLPGARKAVQPSTLKPQLATLVSAVPECETWLHEIKFDGYRILCVVNAGRARLYSRNGQDWTRKLSRIAEAVAQLPVDTAILDGELVALRPDGASHFQTLQNALKQVNRAELAYYLFDLPYCNGYDLRRTPLLERKRLLRQVVQADRPRRSPLRYSEHIQGQGAHVYQHACAHGLEGVVSKRADSPYQSRRTGSWLKVKCTRRQEFVVGGYTDPAGTRKHFGALLLGYHDDRDRLIYCGRVGTGFNGDSLARLHRELSGRTQRNSPFHALPREVNVRGVHWTRPDLVVEVTFAGWTDDGIVRHASFQGQREDKAARDVVLERSLTHQPSQPKVAAWARAPIGRPTTGKKSAREAQDARVAGQRLTHPERILYPEQGVTKRDLAQFYERMADWILPHVVGRPLSLVRCPQGRSRSCFFQKHVTESLPAALHGVFVDEKDARASYITIRDRSGLIALVQLGVLEIHPWASRVDKLERPDIMIFDLDPSPELRWPEIVRAARTLRDRLAALGLTSFVKTSGGKGLHVVLPLARRSSWEDFKSFAKAVAVDAARREPKRYIATASKAQRAGKIFIDWLRNGRGATSVATYSTRARANAPVSTPVAWDELDGIQGAAEFTLANLPQRLESLKQDPWAEFFDVRQSITRTMRDEVTAA